MVPNLFGVGDRFVASRLPGFAFGDFERRLTSLLGADGEQRDEFLDVLSAAAWAARGGAAANQRLELLAALSAFVIKERHRGSIHADLTNGHASDNG